MTTVASPTYGCTFTNNAMPIPGDEFGSTKALRPATVAQRPCP